MPRLMLLLLLLLLLPACLSICDWQDMLLFCLLACAATCMLNAIKHDVTNADQGNCIKNERHQMCVVLNVVNQVLVKKQTIHIQKTTAQLFKNSFFINNISIVCFCQCNTHKH